MTKYESELQELKDWDEVQFTSQHKDFDFIETAGHGYLVVPTGHPQFKVARSIAKYGFKGKQAIYLEEDCEAPEFLTKIGAK